MGVQTFFESGIFEVPFQEHSYFISCLGGGGGGDSAHLVGNPAEWVDGKGGGKGASNSGYVYIGDEAEIIVTVGVGGIANQSGTGSEAGGISANGGTHGVAPGLPGETWGGDIRGWGGLAGVGYPALNPGYNISGGTGCDGTVVILWDAPSSSSSSS